MKKHSVKGMLVVSSVWGVLLVGVSGCATTVTTEKEVTPGGQVSYSRTKVNDTVTSELRRVFIGTVVDGEGIFSSANEGLARSTATQLAVAEMAGKVQSLVKANTVIYNQENVRQVVETQVNAIVRNYTTDFAGYDPGTTKYRVKVSIKGEQLIREIESRLQ